MIDDSAHTVSDFDELADEIGNSIKLTHCVDQEHHIGMRLDKLSAQVFEGFSRVQLQEFIQLGELTVNTQPQKPSYRLKNGDMMSLTTIIQQHGEDLPENIALEVVYCDDDVIVINKPANLVVHPGAGNLTGTLVNALLYHFPNQAQLPRAGLVHRIDKDTTGLLVVARNKLAQLDLIEQLKDKSVYRLYQCIVKGTPQEILTHKKIELPIARHAIHRTKMSVRQGGKEAITLITKATALGDHHSLLEVQLKTGRTHQIRVHLSHLGFALVGDKVYGTTVLPKIDPIIKEQVLHFPRQALHAYMLGFIHPTSKQPMQFRIELPSDMQCLLETFAQSRKNKE